MDLVGRFLLIAVECDKDSREGACRQKGSGYCNHGPAAPAAAEGQQVHRDVDEDGEQYADADRGRLVEQDRAGILAEQGPDHYRHHVKCPETDDRSKRQAPVFETVWTCCRSVYHWTNDI